jgi:hypothetical protein
MAEPILPMPQFSVAETMRVGTPACLNGDSDSGFARRRGRRTSPRDS